MLAECANRGFSISDVAIKDSVNGDHNGSGPRQITVELEVRGQGSLAELATELHGLDASTSARAT